MCEIIFFSSGDSRDVSTWSNVPFLFAKQLENRNICLRRINMHLGKNYKRIYNRIILPILNLFYPNHEYPYERTVFYRFWVNRLIKKSVSKYRTADYCIFFGYDFYNKFNDIPSLLFGDWTYDILIHERQCREFYWFEKKYSKREEKIINSANIVISLFPLCAESIKKQCPNANIHYLGNNVINSLYDKELNENYILSVKSTSKRILFIGLPKYIEGVKLLLESFKIINTSNSYELHIIGMEKSHFDELPQNVFFHGYLHKDNEVERKLYYDLLISAKVFVNPTPLWGGYSSTIESMYFYTPVIVSPYKDFVDEFGENIDFGFYNEKFLAQTLADNILRLVLNPKYLEMCNNAHDRVKDYTWKNYVDKIVSLMETKQ